MVVIKKVSHFRGHTGAVYALEKTSVANTFLSGGSDNMVVQWNLNNPDEGAVILKTPSIIYSLKYFAAGNFLIIGQSTGGIHILDLETKKEIRLLQFHSVAIYDLFISETHQLLFSLGGDGTLQIISLKDFSLLKSIRLGNFKLRCIDMNSDETEIAVGCGDGSIAVFSLPELEIKNKIQAHQLGFSVNAIKYSGDGNLLLSGSRDAHLNIFDVKNNFHLIKSIPAHNYAIYGIEFNPSQKILATASRDKTVKLWDAGTMEITARLDKETYDGHLNSVNKILWMNENTLLSAGDDRSIISWSID